MNEKPDMTKVMDRIAKLLALSSSPNEHEAASAAERAHAMLAEYNLSMSDVSAASKIEDSFIVDDSTMTDSLPWRRSLGTMVATMYFCSYLYAFKKKYVPSRPFGYIRYDVHSFIGAAHNVEVAKVMFKYLTDTIEQLAEKGSLQYPMKERSKYRTSFKASCSNRVCWRIDERIKAAMKGGEVKTEAGTNLPALASLYDQTKFKLDNFLGQKFGKLKSTAVRHTQSHYGGVEDGRKAGNQIGLDQQVGSSKTQRIGSR